MSIERIFPSGAWMIADIVGGYLVTRKYFGFSKRDAIAAFRREFPR